MFYTLLSTDNIFKSDLSTAASITGIDTKSYATMDIYECRHLTQVKINHKFLIAGLNDLYKKRR